LNKKIIIISLLVVTAIAFSVLMFLNTNNDDIEVTESTRTSEAQIDQVAKTEAPSATDTSVVEKPVIEVAKPLSYATVSDYNNNRGTYSGRRLVYFFHASWCPVCQGIENEIKSDISRVPENTTIIQADFDTSTELRKKFGVTYQYTFVQIDSEGNEIKQWSASSLQKVVDGIQ
jgi:thiol-disulfide isomerase/thioredoxin